MKNYKLFPKLLMLFVLIMGSVSVFAETLPHTDTFTNSTNNWSNGTNVTSNTQLQIIGDTNSSKTYNFGTANANKQVTVKFDFWLDGGWESSGGNQDNLNIDANGYLTTLNYGNGSTDPVVGTIDPITATLDGNGTLVLTINPNVTASGENIRIDNVVISAITTTTTTSERNFALRKDIKLYGDVEVIGNTVLCKQTGGVCVEPSTTDSNAETNLQKASESYANLTLPNGVSKSDVKWARLYWQGRTPATTSSTFSNIWTNTYQNNARTIKIKHGSTGTLSTLTADFADFSKINSRNYVGIYSASADVTSFVQSKGSGSYYIDTSSFFTETGETDVKATDDGLGAYGAWTLVVVYANPTTTVFKDIAVFDGYKIVQDTDNDDQVDANEIVEFNVTGFYTPKAPATVNSKVYLFTGEGDKYIEEDKFWMRGGKQASYTELGTFDSRIDVTATRSPSLTNNNGIDIQTYNIGTAGGSNIIGSDEKTAWLKFTTTGDTFFPSLAVFATDIYVPEICYDYSFAQNNRFFQHDTSPTAHIHGYLLNNEPLRTQIMFKNKAAGTEAKNIKLYINDINSTAQLEFYTDSQLGLQKTTPNSYYYNNVPTADVITKTTSDLAFKWVTGTDKLGYSDSVFSTFNLRPLVSGVSIDVPLTMSIDYDYTLDNQTYSMTNIALDSRIQRCIAAPAEYNPVEWIFNVVDPGLNTGVPAEGTTNMKYNLPTHVANRPVDIKVVSFDPTQLDRVKAINGAVAIEIIDVGGYLDPNSACADPYSAITKRAWLQMGEKDANVTTATLTVNKFGTGLNTGVTAQDFFKNVRQNAAYRVSYNLADDNGSIKFDTKTESDGSTSYQLYNFPSYGGGVCAVDMDGNPNNTDTIPSYCGNNANQNAASWMNAAEYRTCMECIYGLKTKSVCSRDNFAIRPEGFDVKIKDPNGLIAIPYDANLSAGYLYQFDVNATNHVDGNATSGYSAWFNGSSPDQNCSLEWQPNGQTVSGCNDSSTPALEFAFANGRIIAQNRKHTNVGRYKLSMRDTGWTKVDQWPISHHDNATNWLLNQNDCATGDAVPIYNSGATTFSTNMPGCTISSEHIKLSTPSAQFRDYNLSFRPHHFAIDLNMTAGSAFSTSILNSPNAWTYMNDLRESPDMGVRYGTNLSAVGADSGKLSNYVKNCFAQPINIDANLSFNYGVTPTGTEWRFRLQDLNITNNTIISDTNGSRLSPISEVNSSLIALSQDAFHKDQNGTSRFNLTLNFDRNSSTPLNAVTVNMQNFQTKCSIASNCSSIADGSSNHSPDVNITTNSNVTYAYARLLTKDIRVFGSNSFFVNGWYEVFNLPTFHGESMQPSKNGVSWFINGGHDDILHGDSIVTRLISSSTASTVNYGGNDALGVERFSFQGITPIYNGKAHVDTAPWLWYAPNALTYTDPSVTNPANAAGNDAACLTHPCFNVTVMPSIGATGSAKSTNEANKASKTSTKGTGWHSTSDYSPAIR